MVTLMKRYFKSLVLFFPMLGNISASGQVPDESELRGYLFAYFTGNDNTREEEAIRFAISEDGYNFLALNSNRPVVKSGAISESGGVRDPHIYRGPDNRFYMVATDMVSARGWDSNRGMVLMRSEDLINWSSSPINIQRRFEGNESLKRVWAPQTIYDPGSGMMMIYWSMKHGEGPDIIYYAYANDDFTDLATQPEVLFRPQDGGSTIDGDIVFKDGFYHLFYKTEGNGNGIRHAFRPRLTFGEWTEEGDYKQQTGEAVEGSSVFKLIGEGKYILMYDVYIKGGYDFAESYDLTNFAPASRGVSMNFQPRHGSVVRLTGEELERLRNWWR